MSRQNIGRVIFVVVLAAVLIAVFALGWNDDNARPWSASWTCDARLALSSQGRAEVTCPATQPSR
jgi:hypothetical protein